MEAGQRKGPCREDFEPAAALPRREGKASARRARCPATPAAGADAPAPAVVLRPGEEYKHTVVYQFFNR